jgi:hypothetical protein
MIAAEDELFDQQVDIMKGLLITVWTLATPESYRSIGNRFDVTKSTVFRVLRRYISCLFRLAPQHIMFPTVNQMADVVAGFFAKANFPGVIGAIDGTHIPIMTPTEFQESYINRKGFHSINMQAVCDSNMKFIYCDVGFAGSVHDARVYKMSTLYEKLDTGIIAIPNEYHMIGDSAYPISNSLITPYRDTGNLTPIQINYNFKHSSTRMTIERAFGMMKCRFRRLKFFDSPDLVFIVQSVIVCSMLHNIAIDSNDIFEDDNANVQQQPPQQQQAVINPIVQQARIAGMAKRDNIAATL